MHIAHILNVSISSIDIKKEIDIIYIDDIKLIISTHKS